MSAHPTVLDDGNAILTKRDAMISHNATPSYTPTQHTTMDNGWLWPLLIMATQVLLIVFLGCYTQALAGQHRWATGRILVQPAAGLSEEDLGTVLNKHRGHSMKRHQRLNLHVVQVDPESELAVAQALAKDPHIAYAEPDMLVELSAITPNDPDYAKAWHLAKIQAPTAWTTTQGEGIIVAILDTGVDATHPDLAGHVLAGWNTASNSTLSSDVYGHGTMVAGTVAASTNNGIGVAAIAGDAQILPVRVTNSTDGYAYYSDIAEALTWAADHGAKVANISYDVTPSAAVTSAAQYLRSKGGVVVVAAGNAGINPGYADNPSMISVSATGSTDTKTSWSSFGNYVDVSAPGSGIWTTTNGGGYAAVSGTSFASPATAAVVALIMASNPGLSPSEVEDVLIKSVDDLGAQGWDTSYGNGRINAARAVQMATQNITVDSQPPVVTMTSPSTGTVAKGLVAVTASALDDTAVSSVSFYANGNLIGTSSTAPYKFSWNSTLIEDGPATLSATAVDAAGNLGTATTISVTVDNIPAVQVDKKPPTVSITSPKNSATVSGTVSIGVRAADNIKLALVTVLVDNQIKCVANTSTVTCKWSTVGVAAGTHTIKAVAQDSAGNTATKSVTVKLAASKVVSKVKSRR